MAFRLPSTLPSFTLAISSSPAVSSNLTLDGPDPMTVPFSTSGVSSPFDLVLISPRPAGGHQIRNLIWVGDSNVELPVLSLGLPATASVSLASHSPNFSRPSGIISCFDLNTSSHAGFVQSKATYPSKLPSPAPPPTGLKASPLPTLKHVIVPTVLVMSVSVPQDMMSVPSAPGPPDSS